MKRKRKWNRRIGNGSGLGRNWFQGQGALWLAPVILKDGEKLEKPFEY